MTAETRRNILSAIGLSVFVALAVGSADQNQNGSSSRSGTANDTPKEIALRSLKLDYKWTKGGFGGVMIADFTIDNPTEYAVKDIEITCTHFGKSGTQIDSNTRTIYEMFPAKGKKIIKDFN